MAEKEVNPVLLKPVQAPKIQGVLQTGAPISPSLLKGKWVILYFYPKDLTSGCSVQAAEFQSTLKSFHLAGAEVIGVSRDSVSTHQKFTEKFGLEFGLIADEGGALCEAFDVWKEKKMYGKSYMGIERSTFLLNPKGLIVAQWRKVKVPGHVAQVLEVLKSLSSAN